MIIVEDWNTRVSHGGFHGEQMRSGTPVESTLFILTSMDFLLSINGLERHQITWTDNQYSDYSDYRLVNHH